MLNKILKWNAVLLRDKHLNLNSSSSNNKIKTAAKAKMVSTAVRWAVTVTTAHTAYTPAYAHLHSHAHLPWNAYVRVFGFVCVRKLSGCISYGSSGRRLSALGTVSDAGERYKGMAPLQRWHCCTREHGASDSVSDSDSDQATDFSSQTVFTNYLTRCWGWDWN